jgi:hypothetical protein
MCLQRVLAQILAQPRTKMRRPVGALPHVNSVCSTHVVEDWKVESKCQKVPGKERRTYMSVGGRDSTYIVSVDAMQRGHR